VKLGVLGGTFDPIHIGHLVVAEEARTRLEFDEVLFVPAGQPWLKLDRDIAPAIHRVEMLRRAIAGNPHFRLSTLETERPGPSYTVDTLTKLQEQLGREASLYFLLGHDTLAELPQWKEPKKVAELCRLVVAPRIGSRNLRRLKAEIPGLLDKIIQLDMPVIGISSSDIRRRIAQRLSIRYLVPDRVVDYIAEHGLYAEAP
jgi:nicotinate-nucleotide adenylyltransferase